MSNLPSLPDIETDELSLFFEHNPFSTQIETEPFQEKSGLLIHQENFPNHGQKCPANNQTRIPDDSCNSSAVDGKMIQQTLELAKSQEELYSSTDDQSQPMTVAKQVLVDNSGLNVKYNNFDESSSNFGFHNNYEDNVDALIPVLEELPIQDANVIETGNDVTDTCDDLSALRDVDEDGDTVLHKAVILQNTQLACLLIQIMVQAGIDLNSRNFLFQTALHLAVLTDQMDILELLLQSGADTTIRDQYGRTPIHIACEMRRPDIVSKLVASWQGNAELRKCLDTKNYEGESCVHIAAKSRDIELMRHLVKHGADINLADEKSGRTSLHFAAENNDVNMVRFLLGNPRINPSAETLNGETPVLLAYLRDFDDTVKVFKELT